MADFPNSRPPTDAPTNGPTDARSDATGHDEVLSLAEARLFARAADGDREAIAEVWHANRRWIAAVLAAHAPRASDIDDLMQEVAATLVAKCRHIRDAASLRGWLRVVAVNAARMAGRSSAIERRSLGLFAGERGRGSAGIDRAAADEARETLALIERLPPIYAEPLMLQATQGLTQRHIADLLDVPETTVETRLARGRRMLRQLASECDAASGGHSTPSASARTATERTHAP